MSTRVLRAVSALVTDFCLQPPHLWLTLGARLPADQPVAAYAVPPYGLVAATAGACAPLRMASAISTPNR